MIGLGAFSRAAWRDIARMIVPTPTAEPPEPMSIIDGEPEDILYDLCHVEDLRGMDRSIKYDPDVWGYFRGKVQPPKRGRSHGTRKWEQVTAIMLHITAVRMGWRRYLGTPCHAGVDCDATVVLCHPLNAYVYHGHAANRFSIGIEISSVDGSVDDCQVEAAHHLVRYCYEERQRHVEGPMAIMAHRQSHRSRTNDPGSIVWRRIGEWAKREIGMVEGPVVGSGKPIPDTWRDVIA